MRRFFAVLLALMMLLSVFGCSKKPEDEPPAGDSGRDYTLGNMVLDGTFDDEEAFRWTIYTESGGVGSCEQKDGALVINVEDPGKLSWAVQAYYDGITLLKGAEYMFRFDISTSIEKNIDAMIQLNGGDYTRYCSSSVACTPEVQSVEIPFTMKYESDKAPRIAFNCGRADTGPEVTADIGPFTVTIDNLCVTCLSPNAAEEEEPEQMSLVNLNQIGYRPGDAKIAIVRGDVKSLDFTVTGADGGAVYSGKLSGPVKNTTAAETDYYADFSELKTPGEYTVVTGDGEQSAVFSIGKDIYTGIYDSVVNMLYLQRCGCEVSGELAGEYSHPACHTGEAIIYGTSEKKDVSGGWHDAGDYGRYVVSGAKAAMDLMLAYEENPSMFGDKTGIPESGNKIPDILDEVKYELDWMLKMQAASGGVYHKVTCMNFPGSVMPQKENDQLYICPVSSCATADFAAVMTHAYSVFKKKDGAFANTCLDAAVKAWDYLEANPFDGVGFTNPADVATGEYGDTQDIDERFWAACELLSVTGDEKYADYISSALADVEKSLADDDQENDLILDNLGWANMGLYGSIAYLSMDSKKADPEVREKILAALTGISDKYVEASKSDGYFISMGESYPWGSNMNIMNNAMVLLFAGKFAPNSDYGYYARQHLNYIFGANALGTCFVTGCGAVSPVNPHHRPSQAVGKPMPGMLVGGVDSYLDDPYAQSVLAAEAPAKCYVDHEQSYSCNEICVYWNSPLIYVMTACCFGD